MHLLRLLPPQMRRRHLTERLERRAPLRVRMDERPMTDPEKLHAERRGRAVCDGRALDTSRRAEKLPAPTQCCLACRMLIGREPFDFYPRRYPTVQH